MIELIAKNLDNVGVKVLYAWNHVVRDANSAVDEIIDKERETLSALSVVGKQELEDTLRESAIKMRGLKEKDKMYAKVDVEVASIRLYNSKGTILYSICVCEYF